MHIPIRAALDMQQEQFADMEAFDQQQEAFADDLITSGDEGLGFHQARRLRAKLRGNRRRLRIGRPVLRHPLFFAVGAGIPYQFGDEDDGFGKLRISFKRPFGKKSIFGKAKRAIKKIKPLRLIGKAAPYVVGGVVGGTLLKKGVPTLFRKVKGIVGGRAEPVAVETEAPPGVPAPAPTVAVDAVGAPIPPSIMAQGAVSPIPGVSAPSPMEQVATAAQEARTEAETGVEPEVIEAGVSPFGKIDLKDPKVALTLAALGIFAVTQLAGGGGRKRGGRRRGRRR